MVFIQRILFTSPHRVDAVLLSSSGWIFKRDSHVKELELTEDDYGKKVKLRNGTITSIDCIFPSKNYPYHLAGVNCWVNKKGVAIFEKKMIGGENCNVLSKENDVIEVLG